MQILKADVITALVKLGELNGKQSEWKSYDFSNTAICVNEKYLFVISEVTSKDFEEMLKVADLTKEQYLNLVKQYGVDKKVRSAEEILAEQNLSKKVGRGSVKATLVIYVDVSKHDQHSSDKLIKLKGEIVICLFAQNVIKKT